MATVFSPLPGKVVHVAVRPGAPVKRGDELLVIESMKMESPITADAGGVVASVAVEVGQSVMDGDVLLVIEPGAASEQGAGSR